MDPNNQHSGNYNGTEEEAEYSVWALPPPEIRHRIKALISTLGSEFEGPEFEPHITLVRATSMPRESAIRMLRSASEKLSPYTVTVFAISGRHLLFQQTPKVMETSAHYWGHFGHKPTRPYKPHSSLLYRDLSEEEAKEVEKRIKELDGEIVGLAFQVSSVGLCKTDTEDKSLESWKIVEICNLSRDQ